MKWVKETAIWRGAELVLSIYKLPFDFVVNCFPRPPFFSCLKVYPAACIGGEGVGSFIHHYTPSIQRGVGIFPFNSVLFRHLTFIEEKL